MEFLMDMITLQLRNKNDKNIVDISKVETLFCGVIEKPTFMKANENVS